MKRNLSSHIKAVTTYCIALFSICTADITPALAQQTRGIGVYPGNPNEYFGPSIEQDHKYRNIALHRAVYQSGAYDYNLTAQLLTDGISTRTEPGAAYLDVLVNGRSLPANERELTINDSEWSSIPVTGSNGTLEYRWAEMDIEADEIVVEGFVAYNPEAKFTGCDMLCDIIAGSRTLSFANHTDTLPGTPRRRKVVSDPNKQNEEPTAMAREFRQTFRLKGKRTFRDVRLTFRQSNALYWSIKEVTFKRKGKPMRNLLPAQRFTSVWKASRGEWAYVDLGAVADISEIKLQWYDRAAQSTLEVSDDTHTWTPLAQPDNTSAGNTRTQTVSTATKGRYIRITLGEDACLSEMEVYGQGGMMAVPHPEQGKKGNKYMLNGGNWTVCPVDCPLPAKAKEIGPAIVATVPATVLSSYHNAGALPDPNYDDNLAMLSESFFNRDFLYKRTFRVPAEMTNAGRRVLLNFDGINWKAHVVLNGKEVGHIKGAFTRGQFDITDLLQEENHLSVYIEKNANPGARKIKTRENTSFNGGVLGADNPTFHATIGWDWITTIPGRDLGIWNDVYLTSTKSVTLSDPIVNSIVNRGKATMTPSVFVRNHLGTPVKGRLSGSINNILFEKEVTLAPKAESEITFSPEDFPQLANQKMKLWWPNGYGEPNLYDANFIFLTDNDRPNPPEIVAVINYKTGIRQVTYRDEMSRLQLYINGRRFIPLGGNWGFSENHLNYRGREYDIAVDYHRQMNCTMIRNWVGQTGDEEFYEACDRHGIMVWQDFWLANPVDGPNPHDEAMFMANAEDYVRLIRRHPSIALYCGRNEGYPPETLNKQLTSLVQKLAPGALYFPSSADDGVSGHGPYRARPVKDYFELQTGKLHSERGMPNVPNYESLRRMLAPEHLWPQNEYWGKHDFTQQGAQYGSSFNELLRQHFGNAPFATHVDTPTYKVYSQLAQWQNYDGYRAMFESSNLQRQGLIIWMSHSCWPSMVWQTYDYYFDPTAAFFGVKKACEPLHVQYNEATNMVQLVNQMRPTTDLEVTATVYDLSGKQLWTHRMDMTIPTDSTMDCFPVEASEADGNRLLRLEAVSRHDYSPISTNDYILWGNNSETDWKQLGLATISIRRDNWEKNEIKLTNTGTAPALMIRLNLCGEDNEQILPVEYTDNYFHLLPGESRTVHISWSSDDARDQNPELKVSGFNIKPMEHIGLKKIEDSPRNRPQKLIGIIR